LKGYFEKVYPEMDFERVYTSDMKKMVQWFQVLNQHEIDFTAEAPAEEEQQEADPAAEPVAEVQEPVAAEEAAPEAAKPKRTRKKKTEE
jgi:hypothetical protein